MGPGESGHACVRAWIRKQAEGRPGLKPLLLFSLQCLSLGRWAPLVPSSLQARSKAKVPSAKSPLWSSDSCNRWMIWKCVSVEEQGDYGHLPLLGLTVGTVALPVPEHMCLPADEISDCRWVNFCKFRALTGLVCYLCRVIQHRH